MPTFIDWPALFGVTPPRVTDSPAASAARRQAQRERATTLPENRPRVTTNPFAGAPLVTPRQTQTPEQKKRDEANARGNPLTKAAEAVGQQAGLFGAAAGRAAGTVGRTLGEELIPRPWEGPNPPKSAEDFAGQPVQGPPTTPPARLPGMRPGARPPEPSGTSSGGGPRLGPFAPGAYRPKSAADYDGQPIAGPGIAPGTLYDHDRAQAETKAIAARVRRQQMEARNARLTAERNRYYDQFFNGANVAYANVPRSKEGKERGAMAVPFVSVENQKMWRQMGINMPRGFQKPEYLAVQFGEPFDKRSDAGAIVSRSSPQELARYRRTAVQLGLVKENDLNYLPIPGGTVGDMTAIERLQALVNETQFTSLNQVIDWTDKMSGSGLASAYQGGGGGGGGGGPQNTTQKVYNKTSLDQGRAILRQTMRELMGREPTDAEVKSYVGALNKRESKTPQIVTTTYGNGGAVITQRTIGNAPDPSEVLRQQAEDQNDPEIAEYEAMGFMGTLDDMLGGL